MREVAQFKYKSMKPTHANMYMYPYLGSTSPNINFPCKKIYVTLFHVTSKQLIVVTIPIVQTLSQVIRIYEHCFPKRGTTLVEPFVQASQTLCHAHLDILGIMCSKFYVDLKPVEGV